MHQFWSSVRYFTRVTQVQLQTQGVELEGVKTKDFEDVYSYVTRVQTLVNQLKRNWKTLTDSRIVEKILQPLTDDFEHVVSASEESKNLEKMIVDDLAVLLKHMNNKRRKRNKRFLNRPYKQRWGSSRVRRWIHNTTEEQDVAIEIVVSIEVEIVVIEIIMKRKDKWATKIDMDEEVVVEEENG